MCEEYENYESQRDVVYYTSLLGMCLGTVIAFFGSGAIGFIIILMVIAFNTWFITLELSKLREIYHYDLYLEDCENRKKGGRC
jgi:hypothetical protein